MTLIQECERNGQLLFRYRGQIPIIFFLAEIIYLFFYPYHDDPIFFHHSYWYLLPVFLGYVIRIQSIGHAGERSSGKNRKQQVAEVLNTSGWYSVVRHPLYLGNFFIWLGFVLVSESITVIIIFCLVFWLYYERIMFAEEAFLHKKFGEEYLKWAERTPAFIPRFKNFRKSRLTFQTGRVLQSEYHMLLEVPGLFFILIITRNYNITGTFRPDMFWVWFFCICAVLWIFFCIRFKLFRKS